MKTQPFGLHAQFVEDFNNQWNYYHSASYDWKLNPLIPSDDVIYTSYVLPILIKVMNSKHYTAATINNFYEKCYNHTAITVEAKEDINPHFLKAFKAFGIKMYGFASRDIDFSNPFNTTNYECLNALCEFAQSCDRGYGDLKEWSESFKPTSLITDEIQKMIDCRYLFIRTLDYDEQLIEEIKQLYHIAEIPEAVYGNGDSGGYYYKVYGKKNEFCLPFTVALDMLMNNKCECFYINETRFCIMHDSLCEGEIGMSYPIYIDTTIYNSLCKTQ
jgi:hypothetical protein